MITDINHEVGQYKLLEWVKKLIFFYGYYFAPLEYFKSCQFALVTLLQTKQYTWRYILCNKSTDVLSQCYAW